MVRFRLLPFRNGIEWFQPTRLIPASGPDESSILTGTMMAVRDRPGLVD
jgi:hypothetical protein